MEATGTNLRPESQLLYYWNILVKRRLVIAAFAIVITITVAVSSVMSKPVYKSTASIEIAPQAPTVLANDRPVASLTPDIWLLDQYYATQYELIRSTKVMSEAVRRLREEHAVTEFDGVAMPDRKLKAMVAVSPKSGTNIVFISVEHNNPEMATLYANEVARAYISFNLDRSLEAGRQAFDWLAEQRRLYERKQVESQRKTLDFRTAKGLGSEEGVNATVETQESLQAAWSAAHTTRVVAEARNEELRRIAQSEDWKGLANTLAEGDTVLKGMLADEKTLEQERTKLSARYKSEHPEMQRVSREIEGINVNIRSQLKTMIDAQQAEVDLARAEEDRLTTELDLVTKALAVRGSDLIELKVLESEAERNELFFRSLDERMTEVGLSQFMQANNIRMVDEAILPGAPIRPQVLSNVLSAILVGLVGGAALALALEYVDATIQSREEVEAATNAPMLGIVPMIAKEQIEQLTSEIQRSIFVYAMPKSNVAECLRTVRTNILFQASKKPVKRMLITSAAPREGKSFIASNLSAIIAMAGTRVLTIDGDLRRPTLHKRFHLSNDIGFSNVLMGQVSLKDAIQPTHVPGLHILTTGPSPGNPSELLGADRVRDFLDAITGYDLIILDSPPVNVVSDALVMASLTDGVVFVVEAGRTSRRLVMQCAQRLKEANPNLFGTIVNKLDVRHAGYGYYYYYYDYAYYMEGNADDPRAAAQSGKRSS